MFRVVTRNSVYSVRPTENGFHVKRIASTWGQTVRESHSHFTRTLNVTVDRPMVTDYCTTSPVVAIVPSAE